jgi:DNA-binding MarR family transcriptional regulator
MPPETGPLSPDFAWPIHALAKDLAMDRTTLGGNILPLEWERLIAVATGRSDPAGKQLRLTEAGAARLLVAAEGWAAAHTRFEEVFGGKRSRNCAPSCMPYRRVISEPSRMALRTEPDPVS